MKHYEKGDRIPTRAQQIWLILTAHAVLKPSRSEYGDRGWSGWRKGLITYGDLAEQMGMDRKAALTLNKHLGVIGYYCKEEKLPPLNAIAVNSETGEPGYGVVESQGFKMDQTKVWDMNWFSIRPPTIRELRAIYDKYIATSR